MSEPENFLGRWSRRKLEAEKQPDAPARLPEGEDPAPRGETAEHAAPDSGLRANEQGPDADASKPASSEAPKEEEPAFDIASLPSIDSITAATDVRVFLQKGVPAELTRAALRRAWTADPAIRDFIEIAENQYDFATGSDLPGFGALDVSADDLRRMVADVFGGFKVPDAPESPATESETEPASRTAETPAESGSSEAANTAGEPAEAQAGTTDTKDQMALLDPSEGVPESIVHRNEENIAMQQSNRKSEPAALPARRPHGRALPQ